VAISKQGKNIFMVQPKRFAQAMGRDPFGIDVLGTEGVSVNGRTIALQIK
jgi:hypothetical protein